MKDRKQKKLIYKHVLFHLDGPDLEDILKQALIKCNVGARREPLAPKGENPIWRLIGHSKIETEFVFGVLMRYMPGTNSAYLIDDEFADNLTIEQMTAPITLEGKRREAVEDMLFFGILDNHLVMMQSTALRSEHLETHIQWLVHNANTLPGSNSLQLTDQMPKNVMDMLATQSVRSVELGSSLTSTTAPTGSVKTAESISVSPKDASSKGIIDSIKSLLSQDAAANLDLDSLHDSNIEYTLSIRYRKSTSKNGQKLMNTLGSALRHAEGVNTKICLVDGGEIKGEDLKLSGSVRIDTYDGIPNADEVFAVMKKWLLDKIKSGDVKPK